MANTTPWTSDDLQTTLLSLTAATGAPVPRSAIVETLQEHGAKLYTIEAREGAREQAAAQARGCYQRALIEGCTESWSGSTLRGKAANYGGRYARSRASLIRRVDCARLRTRPHGAIVVALF